MVESDAQVKALQLERAGRLARILTSPRVLIGFVVVVLIFFFFVVLLLLCPSLFKLPFDGPGQIGDTIGGVLGPLIAFASAWLVYASFLQQYVANEIQRSELEKQRLSTHFADLKRTEDTLIYFVESKRQTIVGAKAIFEFAEVFQVLTPDEKSSALKQTLMIQLSYLILEYEALHEQVNVSTLSDAEKNLWCKRLVGFYDAKFSEGINHLINALFGHQPDHELRLSLLRVRDIRPKENVA